LKCDKFEDQNEITKSEMKELEIKDHEVKQEYNIYKEEK
jgi:hypothetical protein